MVRAWVGSSKVWGVLRCINRLWFNHLGLTFSLGNVSPLEKKSVLVKCSCLTLTHRLRRSPLSRRTRVMLDDGFCDFAFGFAQNDRRWEVLCEDGRFGIRGTNKKGVWGYGYRFLLMQVHWFFESPFCKSINCANLIGNPKTSGTP